MTTAETAVDVARVRWWLTNLSRPERLADPHMAALLRAHGRPAGGSPLEVGRSGARLLADAIEGLAGAGLPHRVLRTCFVEGVKNRQAAARLGLSERQLSRERSRAIALLVAQLAPRDARVSSGAPPPPPEPFLARPRLARALADALHAKRRVRVAGAPGSGKTTLVAAHAAAAGVRTFWCRGVTRLPALLFDLAEHLQRDDPSLAGYVRSALPDLDEGLATRIALAGLAGRDRLMVLDGAGALDGPVDSFLGEAVARLPRLSVVEIGVATARACVSVPPFDVDETAALLRLAGVHPDHDVVAGLQAWTAGNPRLVALASSWLRDAPGARAPLEDALRRRCASLTALRGMTGAALAGASRAGR